MQINWKGLIKPKRLEAEEESLTATYGKFVGEPFERGFGTTIGNSLRRVLLSSLYGAAITSVRIKDILHEFSTITGVTEDVTDIVLNLKEIRVMLSDAPQDAIRLSVKGAKKVSGADLVTGPHVQILNPDHHIATLSKEGELDMEMTVRQGRGYVSAEHNKDEGDPVGTIPLDAIFSPVRKVNFNVTNARVGQRTDTIASCSRSGPTAVCAPKTHSRMRRASSRTRWRYSSTSRSLPTWRSPPKRPRTCS